MASLPPRQQSQRQSSPEQASSQSQAQASQSPVRTRSATSEDSQTLFLNSPADSTESQQKQQQSSALPHARPLNNDDDPSIKKCWICFADSTEDTPETSPWRDPCPCALVAHEECLLDWIADTEAPKNSRNRSIGPPRIECPQCKAEIKLARPTNYIVEAVRGMERLGAKMTTPGALTILSATIYNSSMAWGIHSIYAVFGAEDGYRILRPLILNATRPPVEVWLGELEPRQAVQRVLGLFIDHLVHWRLYVGLPLITPVLVLSRTRLADSILPVLPILFFATQSHNSDEAFEFGQWPPSASLAFAVLPYIRSAYNAYYQKVWAEKEKQWLKEIQPRNGQSQNDATGNADNANMEPAAQRDADADNIFEVRIDGDIWEDWDDEPAAAQGQQNAAPNNMNVAPPLQQPPLDDDQAQPPPNIADNRAQGQQQAANAQAPQAQPAQPGVNRRDNNNNNNERRLSFSPTAIAETVLGAILFPTIAGMSGELLKFLLPRSWTTPPSAPAGLSGMRVSARGLLQEKWGRSLVGGCLFVVAKDALMLYVRWRMASMHRARKVVDYDRQKRGKRRL